MCAKRRGIAARTKGAEPSTVTKPPSASVAESPALSKLTLYGLWSKANNGWISNGIGLPMVMSDYFYLSRLAARPDYKKLKPEIRKLEASHEAVEPV